jgi:hypothetical protein
MTYDPFSPEATISPKMSPSQIQTNFQVFSAAESANHVAMNSIGQGKHTAIIFKNQSADPIVDNTFGTIYAKTAVQASGNAINLFYRTKFFIPGIPNNPQQITFNTIQYTGVNVTLVGPPASVYTNMQQSFAFGGFIIYTGKVVPNNGVAPFLLDVAVAGSGIVKPSRIVYARILNQSASFAVKPLTGSIIETTITGIQTYNYFAIGLV